MTQRLPAVFLTIALLAGAGSVGLAVDRAHRAAAAAHAPDPTVSNIVATAPTATPEPSPSAAPTPTPAPTPLPASVLIKVPYTSQAPLGWSGHPEYEEFCEAAAVLMTGRYYRGDARETIPGPEADQALRQIVAYERGAFPGVLDLNLTNVSNVGAQVYQLDSTVAPATPDSIRQELANGHPVIIPVMTHGLAGGRAIAPFYGVGNVYHVILLKGYDTQKGLYYSNDAGFTQGENYAYTWDILATAMDAQAAKMGQGRLMLVFKPKAA